MQWFFTKQLQESFCDTLVYCFYTSLNQGSRAHGGLGDLMQKKSWEKSIATWFNRFIFSMIYYILIIILILNIVFGIIIDNFREQRVEMITKQFDAKNICFICGGLKDDFEKEGINFQNHRQNDHYFWNYVYYLIGLKFSNIQDLNAANSYAYEKILNKDISFFPDYESTKTRQ